MTSDAPTPRSEALGVAEMRRAGDVGHDADATPDYSTVSPSGIPQHHCPRCAFTGPHMPGSGSGPHYARLLCGQCGAFIRWLPKPRPVV
jgi:hypothetical protein